MGKRKKRRDLASERYEKILASIDKWAKRQRRATVALAKYMTAKVSYERRRPDLLKTLISRKRHASLSAPNGQLHA